MCQINQSCVFKINTYVSCINIWPKNSNSSWDKVIFFKRKHSFSDYKNGRRSLFIDIRTRNIFFDSVLAYAVTHWYMLPEAVLALALKVFFPSCLFSIISYYFNTFDHGHLHCSNEHKVGMLTEISIIHESHPGISNILAEAHMGSWFWLIMEISSLVSNKPFFRTIIMSNFLTSLMSRYKRRENVGQWLFYQKNRIKVKWPPLYHLTAATQTLIFTIKMQIVKWHQSKPIESIDWAFGKLIRICRHHPIFMTNVNVNSPSLSLIL